jgi:hypothetical protein
VSPDLDPYGYGFFRYPFVITFNGLIVKRVQRIFPNFILIRDLTLLFKYRGYKIPQAF